MNKEIDLLKKNSIAFGNLGRGGTDDEMVKPLSVIERVQIRAPG